MASIAFDSDFEDEAGKPPISLHPAFPAIVALWFAALLGVGCLVLPAVLLESAVTATGIASLVPAAAPPLGLTARSLIALVGALAGAGIGISLARRVAQGHRPVPASRIAQLAGGSRRPISVKDEVGGEGVVNGHGLPLNRRRALAISEDDRPSDFLYQVPLPGNGDATAPFAGLAAETETPDEEPLELSEVAGAAEENAETSDQAAPAAAPEDSADEDFEMTDASDMTPEWRTEQHFPRDEVHEPASELDTRKNLAGPRGLEPLPFSAPSLARRAQFAPEPEPEFEPEPELAPETGYEPEPDPVVTLAPAPAPQEETYEFRADWETAPLEGLGLVQLVQRLGSTIERRREWMASVAVAPAPAAAPFAAAPADFEPAEAEEAAQAMAAFFAPEPDEASAAAKEPADAPVGAAQEDEPVEFDRAPEPAPATQPQFLRPIVAEDADDDASVPDFSLPLRRPVAATVSFAANTDDAEERDEAGEENEILDDAGEAGYSSLLGMSNPFAAPRNEFVRIEEPVEDESSAAEPTVVFPGQEDPAPPASGRLFDPPGKASATSAPSAKAPGDTDAALRAALATLQRMSGAA